MLHTHFDNKLNIIFLDIVLLNKEPKFILTAKKIVNTFRKGVLSL